MKIPAILQGALDKWWVLARMRWSYRIPVGLLILVAVASSFSMAMSGDTVADRVLGQFDFSNNAPNLIDAPGLKGPFSVAIDASVTPNRLYVADSLNSRVLGYKDVTTFINGGAADLVIGQPDFISGIANNGGLSANSLNAPEGVAVDADGNLYVADSLNNRALEYNTPFTGCGSFPCVGGPANLEFGQDGSFASADCNNGGVSAGSLPERSASV